jgi:hypothetical protein
MKKPEVAVKLFISLAIGITLIFVNMSPAFSRDATNIAGKWKGAFYYDDASRQGQVVGSFTMDLKQRGSTIDGNISEPRTDFGPKTDYLTSSFSGTFDAATMTIRFTKTYDYDGHTVEYYGTLNPAGNRASGQWQIKSYKGIWNMDRM